MLVDDGHGDDDVLYLIVEIKGYRREDAKEKKATMETCWVAGVNNNGQYVRWAFAEFTDAYQIQADFKAKVESQFNKMIESVYGDSITVAAWTVAPPAEMKRGPAHKPVAQRATEDRHRRPLLVAQTGPA